MNFYSRRSAMGLAVLAAMGLALSGCVVDIGNGNGNSNSSSKITIRVINNTTFDLDPQLYTSSTTATEAELFADANKFTAIGVASRGLVGALSQDSVEIDCADARVFGTLGGDFLKDDGSSAGTGTKRVLSQGLTVQCGDRVTLTYTRGLTGEFQTTLSLN